MSAKKRYFSQHFSSANGRSGAILARNLPSRLPIPLALIVSCMGYMLPNAQAASLGSVINDGVVRGTEALKTGSNTNKPNQLTFDNNLNEWPQHPAGKLATYVAGENISGHPNQEVDIKGKAEIRKSGTVIQADHLHYNQETDKAKAEGNVYINRSGVSFTGPAAEMQVDAIEGEMKQPLYTVPKTGGNGKADSLTFQSKDEISLTKATYTTCSPSNVDWYLKASRLDLDNDRKVGTGYGGVLYFYDVPVLAAPIFTFPLTTSRQTGLLTPLFEQSTAFGFAVTLPYYFNIAPNRDLTLYPRFLSERGAQLGGEYRYLGDSYSGSLKGEYLLNDRKADRNRWAYALVHKQDLKDLIPGLNAYMNLNKVSDNSYPDDLGRSVTTPALVSTRQNLQEAGLAYAHGPWSGLLRVQEYQTLPPVGGTAVNPYNREPQFNLKFTKFDIAGFDFSSEFDTTRFVLPTSDTRVTGNRTYSLTQLSYPIQTPSYFVIPKISLNASRYELSTAPTSYGYNQTNFNRVLPTVSLDTGLYFEREATELSRWTGSRFIQTLEPRLFYAYTPYRTQTMLPQFDTSKMDLSAGTIFTANPYSGNDRIADANSLTAGVTTRFIDAGTMKERFKFTLAQRFYFSNQRVLGEQNAADGVTYGAPSNYRFSDVLMGLSAQVYRDVYFNGGMQYTTYNNTIFASNAGISWRPDEHKVLNASWRYRAPQLANDTNAIAQIDISGQWPITSRLYAIARYNYDLRTKQAVDVLAGIEYDASCWAMRFVLHRYANATVSNASTTTALVQLDLKGLSNFGTDALGILKLSIPGYQPVVTPSSNAQP